MIRAIIFDLDGTLYRNKVIERKFAEAAYFTLAKFKKIDQIEARRVVEAKRAQLSAKKGYRIPYTHTLHSLGVPTKYWHKENVNYFDARDYLKRDRPLAAALCKLESNYELAVVTNNNRTQTERILEALGIKRLFSVIQTFTDCKFLKPDPRVFIKVARKLGVKPGECLSVGDRVDVDLLPSSKIGMKTFQVTSPRGINRLLKSRLVFS